MKICQNCNIQLSDDSTFCPTCGRNVETAPALQQPLAQQPNYFNASQQQMPTNYTPVTMPAVDTKKAISFIKKFGFWNLTGILGGFLGIIMGIINIVSQDGINYLYGYGTKFGADFYTEIYDITRKTNITLTYLMESIRFELAGF